MSSLVAKIWPTFSRKSNRGSYDVTRLVDRRVHDQLSTSPQIICDIDKTYLETQFESLLNIARIAFEDARAKVTVRGASDFLLALRWGRVDAASGEQRALPLPLHFVSSSPPQLRPVLTEKLTMDGLDWSSDTFKNQAYNLRVGRVDLLRQHIAYKVCAILQLIESYPVSGPLYFVGDNAESDAYIYLGVSLLLSGRLSEARFIDYLEIAGVEPRIGQDILGPFTKRELAIGGILIREVPGYQFKLQPPLTNVILKFENYFEACLLLLANGVLAPESLKALVRRFHNRHGFSRRLLTQTLVSFADAHPRLQDVVEPVLDLLPSKRVGLEANPFVTELQSEFDALDAEEILKYASRWFEAIKRH